MKKSMLAHPVVMGLLASLCCLLWGSVVPFLNVGYREFLIDSADTATLIVFAGCRFCMAGALTIAFASAGKKRFARPKKGNWHLAVKLCLVQTVLQYVFFYMGVANTPSVKASIIQGMIAFVSLLTACYLFRSEKMNGMKWLGGFLGVAGIVLVNLDGSGLSGAVTLRGEGALFTSMFFNALSAGLIKRYGRYDDAATLSGWQFLFGGAVMAVCGYAMGGRLHPQSALAFAVLLYLAMVSAVAYTLWAVLLNHNPVSSVTAYTCLQPLFGVGLSLLLVPDASAPLVRYGAALVLVCASIAVVGRAQQKKA